MGVSVEMVAQGTRLTEEEVQDMKNSNNKTGSSA
jgi:hypothetical protein